MPTVSLCIPTYNRKDYLKETLASIFAQTYKDYEVVILDDGSTDGTGEMVKKSGYNLRYYWHENQGEAATCNDLIKLAEGRYISFVHSDDLLYPYSIEQMAKAALAEPEDVVVYGGYVRIDEHGNNLGHSRKKLYSGHITRYVFENNIIHACGSLFPKKAMEEIGGFDTSLKVCCDYRLELKLSLKYRFIAVDKPTFMRRRHSSNSSNNSFMNRKTELDVLSDFYYNGGGKEVIPRRFAMKRLSKESYRAGRWAIKERLLDQACQLLGESFKLHPNSKALIHLARAKIIKKLA